MPMALLLLHGHAHGNRHKVGWRELSHHALVHLTRLVCKPRVVAGLGLLLKVHLTMVIVAVHGKLLLLLLRRRRRRLLLLHRVRLVASKIHGMHCSLGKPPFNVVPRKQR